MLGKFLLAFMLAQTQANKATGLIRGQVIVPSVQAAERIQVIIQRLDGPIVGRIFTDTLGNYELRNIPVGVYEIVVNLEGYEEYRLQVGVAAGTFNAVTANIPLREKEKMIIIKPDGGAADDIVDITELGRKYPKKAVQDYEKAREELRKGNDARAAELFLSVLKLAPDFYGAHNTLGTIYQKSSRFREAETEYRLARDLNPRTAEPLVNLGSLFLDEAAARLKDGKEEVGKILDSALDVLEESIKIKRSPPAYYFLGTAYYKSDFYEEAEENLKRALEMEPRFPAGHLMLANVHMKQRRWREALEQLDAYLNENPKAADLLDVQATRAKVAERIR